MPTLKDSMGRFITSGLFKETAQGRGEYMIWSLDECRELYIVENDPTGYNFAMKHLAGYKHWLALKESPALAHHILLWEEELEVKLRAQGLQEIITTAKGDKGYQAAKYLVESGWIKKTAGRPTKAAIKKESRLRASLYDEFAPTLTSVK